MIAQRSLPNASALTGVVERFGAVTPEADGFSATIRVIVPPGPETLWPLIREMGIKGSFTAHDVAWRCSAAPAAVESYIGKLHAAALVSRAGETTDRKALWQLGSRKVQPPFLDGRGNPSHAHETALRIWKALRMAKVVSVTTLRNFVDDRDFTLSADTARTYLNALMRAGYLDLIPAEQACGENRYRLRPVMMTGPLPPRLLRATLVYDPNRQSIANATVAAEEVRL